MTLLKRIIDRLRAEPVPHFADVSPRMMAKLDAAIEEDMRLAAIAHFKREGVDPYDLAGPIDGAMTQMIADELRRVEEMK